MRASKALAGLLIGCAIGASSCGTIDLSATSTRHTAVIRAADGALRGDVTGTTGAVFRGIAFAKPPVGDLRWRPPQGVTPWRAVREARVAAPACAQNPYGDWNAAAAAHGSENCLYLELRTPDLHPPTPLPVLVWFHGGSNRAGSSAGKVDTSFTRRGIVVVAAQYRLAAFGFLSHPALSAESPQASSGNYGLLDQIAALKWVQTNISAFGGDPTRVTIAGDSAGAQDVGLLLASPLARGLFARAIAQSGTPQFGWPTRSLAENESIGEHLAELIGAANLAAMRAADARAILDADEKLRSPTLSDQSYLWLQAVVDGWVMPSPPRDLFAAGASADVPLLIGSNARELSLPGSTANADRFLREAFGAAASRARAYYRRAAANAKPDPRLGDVLDQLATDVTFRCPAGNTALLHARFGRPVYRYQFDHSRDGGPVTHGAELSIVMNDDLVGGPGDTRTTMQAYWAEFIKTGNPNVPGLPPWPAFDGTDKAYLEFGPAGPQAHVDLRGGVCALLDRL